MIQTFNGDCLEVMKEIPDKSIDMVVTSPPYDNLREYNNALAWSLDVFKPIAKELSRVIKDGGVIVWIVNDATIKGSETGTSFKQALYFKDECGLNLHDTMIWQKMSPFQHKNRYIASFEYMFILSKGKPKTTNLICDRKNICANRKITGTERNKDGKTRQLSGEKRNNTIKEFGSRCNIWEMRGEGNNRTGHPAVFPTQLINDHIITWSNENDIVLDPFMGSGTTGIVCLNTNRNFIGIELDKAYYDMACKRLEI